MVFEPLQYSTWCSFTDIDKDKIQNKRALSAIQESLIGFTGNLENKTFLHEGALIELDPDSYRPICRVYFFLLNDLLIVGKVKHDKYVEKETLHIHMHEVELNNNYLFYKS